MKEIINLAMKNLPYYQNADKSIKYFYTIRNYHCYEKIQTIVKIPFSRKGKYYASVNSYKTIYDVIYEFCRNGYLEGLKLLNLDFNSDNSINGFMTACIFGHYNIVKYFIKCGINVNHRNEYGNTGLTCAIVNDHDKIIKLLISSEADIHYIHSITGNSYLHEAVQSNPNVKIIQMLIDAGIDVHRKNYNNNSVMDVARVFPYGNNYRRKQVIDLLSKYIKNEK